MGGGKSKTLAKNAAADSAIRYLHNESDSQASRGLSGDEEAHKRSEDVVLDFDSTYADNDTEMETSVYSTSVRDEDADTNKPDTVEASGPPRAEDEQPEKDSLKLPTATHRYLWMPSPSSLSSSLPSTPEAAAGP